jgi:hypothetical protein
MGMLALLEGDVEEEEEEEEESTFLTSFITRSPN